MAKKTEIIQPVHVGEIDGLKLRYFQSPLHKEFNQADLPWHSLDDLRALTHLPEDIDERLRTQARQDWDELRTVATPDGITTIAPHFMAEGLIDFLIRHPSICPKNKAKALRASYRRNQTEAMKIVTSHLNAVEKLLFFLSAVAEDDDTGEETPPDRSA